MKRTTTSLCSAFALALALSPFAQAQTREIPATGEYTMSNSDTPESAMRLGLLDAKLNAVEQAGIVLQGIPEVKDLGLSEAQIGAYAAGIVETVETNGQPAGAAPAGNRTVHRTSVLARIDMTGLAQRLGRIRNDTEASHDLLAVWKRIEQLRQRLAEQNQILARSDSSAAGKAAQDRQQTVTALDVNLLLARASAALAKTEQGPTSTLTSTSEGPNRAKLLAEQALGLDPDSSDARYKLGDALLADGQVKEAEREFQNALLRDSNSSGGHIRLGNALMAQRNYTDAMAEFRESIRIDPNNAGAHSDLGLTLKAQRKLADAITEFRESIRIDPDFVDGHNNLAVALANQGRIPDAVAEFREVIRINPDAALGHYNLAIALADMEKDREAIEEFRKAIRINPNHYNAHFNMAEMLRLEGELIESAKGFREYIRLAPKIPETQTNIERARTYAEAFEDQ